MFEMYGYDIVFETIVPIYTSFMFYYPTLAEAQALQTAYTAALKSVGFNFAVDQQTGATRNDVLIFSEGDYTYQVSFYTLDKTGAYQGYIEIFFGAIAETVSGADAGEFLG